MVTDVDFNGVSITKRKHLRERWKSHKKQLRAAGIEQAPIAFRCVDRMKVDEYRNSIPLNLPALGRGVFA